MTKFQVSWGFFSENAISLRMNIIFLAWNKGRTSALVECLSGVRSCVCYILFIVRLQCETLTFYKYGSKNITILRTCSYRMVLPESAPVVAYFKFHILSH